ncbi:MAG: TrmH family RNA methyltransferase [Bacteroidetes bacterium]|nr:TrmH family RNA methyltransferase [Bacteroidota bacterium]
MARKLKNIELNRLSVEEFKKASKRPLIVVLDNVRSMLNVGSLFRTSDAFRVEHMYLCGITPHPPHREITKSALGAELSVPWTYVKSVEEVIIELKRKGWRIVGVEQTTSSVELQDWSPNPEDKYALVFGHEVDGLSEAGIQGCNTFLEIPQFGTKHSLNISVCAGIVLWHAIQSFISKEGENNT